MKNRDLTTMVYEHIRNQILNFQLLSGVKISDKRIADDMGISRSPVRQALFRLAENGLLESRHNRGFMVKTFTVKEVEDLHVLRETLELKAIDLLMERLNDSITEELASYVEGLAPLVERNDIAGITEIDWKFHNLVIEASQNTLMIDFFSSLQDRIKISFPHIQTQGSILWAIYDEHKEICDNIRHKNPAGAKFAMSKHIRGALDIHLSALQSYNN